MEYIMVFDNKTILITGLIIGGIFSIYAHQMEIASAIFGGLIGYLSKDYKEGDSNNGSDSESA